MSQHFYSTQHDGRDATILMGWDRPLQGFFLVVEVDDGEDEYLYSNLSDPELVETGGMFVYLDNLRTKLAEIGINVPEAMIREVAADAIRNEGNRQVWHQDNVA